MHVEYNIERCRSTGSTGNGCIGKKTISLDMPFRKGEEAGNEAGYVVGMSTCYPKPGCVKISKGETLILESMYSSIQQHTGVMELFYLLVAKKLP
ncbi:hypothetical protein GQ457_11G029850 [Hibiscus cannabinus]